jgi:hypothetical protein
MVMAVFLLLGLPAVAVDQFRIDWWPTLGGLGWLIPWLLYPGLASLIASRSSSETAVTVVAVLLPALAIVIDMVRPPIDLIDVFVPLAVAAGVYAGTWAGTTAIRESGRNGPVLGIVVAASAGLFVAALVALPALLQPGYMDPMAAR